MLTPGDSGDLLSEVRLQGDQCFNWAYTYLGDQMTLITIPLYYECLLYIYIYIYEPLNTVGIHFVLKVLTGCMCLLAPADGSQDPPPKALNSKPSEQGREAKTTVLLQFRVGPGKLSPLLSKALSI